MRKKILSRGVLLMLCGFLSSASAEVDVTSNFLSNAGFNNNCNYLYNSSSGNLSTSTDGSTVKAVSGWIKEYSGWSAGASFECGYPGTINSPGSIPNPASDGISTGSGAGVLGVCAAWSGQVTYFQNLTLPPGVYKIKYKAFNSGPSATAYSKVGWNDGTTPVLSSLTSFAMGTWTEDSVVFSLSTTKTGKIQVGISAPNSGSGSSGRIFFDHVQLFAEPNLRVSKSSLKFDSNYTSDSFSINSIGLSNTISITAPVGITVSPTSLPANNTNATVTVSYDGSTAVNGNITITSGAFTQNIAVRSCSNANCFTPLYPGSTNLIGDPYLSNLNNFTGWGTRSITTDRSYCGATSGKISSGAINKDLTGIMMPNTTYRVRAKIYKENPGHISYTLASSVVNAGPTIYNLINTAMDSACRIYNRYFPITTNIWVSYNPGVPTAQANYYGSIAFGSNTGFMWVGTAMHEIDHYLGSGQHWNWKNMVSGGKWTGAVGNSLSQELSGSVISSDGTHFWPNGINYSTEITSLGGYQAQLAGLHRNARIAKAMIVDDAGLGTNVAPVGIGVWGWNGTSANIYHEPITAGQWEEIDFTFTTGDTLGTTQGVYFNSGNGYIDNWEMYEVPFEITDLKPSSGFLSPAFSTSTSAYTLYAPPGVELTAVTTQANGTITNNQAILTPAIGSVSMHCESIDKAYQLNLNTNASFMPFSSWSAEGSTSTTTTYPNQWGWNIAPSTGTPIWGYANTSTSSIRFKDNPAGYVLEDNSPFTGRILYTRWDGFGANTSSYYSYPVYLQADQTYKFSGKFAWNSNGSGNLNYYYGINSQKDNTGTSLAMDSLTISSVNRLKLYHKALIFTPTTSGVYYLTIRGNQPIIGAVADLSIKNFTTPTLSLSASSLSFTTTDYVKTFTVSGNSLVGNITLSAPTGITLSSSMILATENQFEKTITATWDKTVNVSGNIILSTPGLGNQLMTLSSSDVENSTLSAVNIGTGGVLSPTFDSETTSYMINAPADIDSVSVAGTSSSPISTISNNGNSATVGSPLMLSCSSYNAASTTNYTFDLQNYTLADWDANGSVVSSYLSNPSTYGWKCTNLGLPNKVINPWNYYNNGNCRYFDNPSNYKNPDLSPFTGRIMYIRWDGNGNNTSTVQTAVNSIYSYPLNLQSGVDYQISGKTAWNSNSSAPALVFNINSTSDNSGTVYATTSVVTGASGYLKNVNLANITVPVSGIYYLTISQSAANIAASNKPLCAVSDFALSSNSGLRSTGAVNPENTLSIEPLTDDNQESIAIKIYSNQRNQITIIVPGLSPVGSVTLTGTLGYALLTSKLTGNSTVINSNLNPGIYMVTVTAAGRPVTQKIVIK